MKNVEIIYSTDTTSDLQVQHCHLEPGSGSGDGKNSSATIQWQGGTWTLNTYMPRLHSHPVPHVCIKLNFSVMLNEIQYARACKQYLFIH